MSEHRKDKNIMGIWDANLTPISLGGLLILIEELQIQCIINAKGPAGLSIVCDEANKNLPGIISVLKNMEGIDTCYVINAFQGLKRNIDLDAYFIWPSNAESGEAGHSYGSTLSIQEFYRKEGFIPHLSCKIEVLIWAKDFITRYCLPRLPVVVHLKNDPKHKCCSNADFDAWFDFLTDCQKKYDVTFILIGNEEIPKQIASLPNVLVTKELGGDLSKDLALIQLSYMFMGMASGPCNMAVFSDLPYIIYKDPDHHAEEMKKELGDNDHFSFATPLQKILRVVQVSSNLVSEFDYFYGRIRHKDWELRFANSDKATTINKTQKRK